MKVKLKQIGMALLVTGIVIYGCRKKERSGWEVENEKTKNKSGSVSAVFPNLPSYGAIDGLLRWVALGVADQGYNQANFKNRMHNYLLTDDNYTQKNGWLQSNYTTDHSYDYEFQTFTSINLRYFTNNYDRNYFYGFEYNGCDWSVGVTSPELADEDFSKPLVVAPAYVNDPSYQYDQYFAYFYNTLTSAMDSVLIIDGDNDEDYYKWFVYADNDCNKPLNSERMGGLGCGESNGKCEPWLGETIDCPDCATKLAKFPNHISLKNLMLHSVTYVTDWKNKTNWPGNKYQETGLAGNYEVAFNYVVYDDVLQDIKDSFSLDNFVHNVSGSTYTTSTTSGSTYPYLDILSATGKNAEIKRCKERTRGRSPRCNRGVSSLSIIYDVLLTDVFDPINDNIAFNMSEFDRTNGANLVHAVEELWAGKFFATMTPTSGPTSDIPNMRPWTASNVQPPGVPPSIANFAFYDLLNINKGAGWVSGAPINGLPAYYLHVTNPHDDEMEWVFVYTDK